MQTSDQIAVSIYTVFFKTPDIKYLVILFEKVATAVTLNRKGCYSVLLIQCIINRL